MAKPPFDDYQSVNSSSDLEGGADFRCVGGERKKSEKKKQKNYQKGSKEESQLAGDSFGFLSKILGGFYHITDGKITNEELREFARKCYEDPTEDNQKAFLKVINRFVEPFLRKFSGLLNRTYLTDIDLYNEIVGYIFTKQLKYLAYPREGKSEKEHYPKLLLKVSMIQRIDKLVKNDHIDRDKFFLNKNVDISSILNSEEGTSDDNVKHSKKVNISETKGSYSRNPLDYVLAKEFWLEYNKIKDELLKDADEELKAIHFLKEDEDYTYKEIAEIVRPKDFSDDPKKAADSVKSRYYEKFMTHLKEKLEQKFEYSYEQ